MYGVGSAPSPEACSRIDAHFGRLLPSLAPWSTGGAYLNFAEREPSARKAFSGETYARLAAVKRAWDPANVIAANHQVVVEE